MGLRVHHLNCGTMCPWGGSLMDGLPGGVTRPGRVVCHCLLIETGAGLVLVDTGLGMRDVARPHPRLAHFFTGVMRPVLHAEETAIAQVRRLGFAPDDVRHIVLTHLDFDHAGGLEDFPQAEVHVYRPELAAAKARQGFIARGRYRPDQWDGVHWRTYEADGESWHGFRCVRGLPGVGDEVLLVPLAGHTLGHCGVAVRADGAWLLHAGDAYFHRDEMAMQPHCTPGLRMYQAMMEVDRRERLRNQDRLRGLRRDHGHEVRIFCAHDPVELTAARHRG